jgi:hypothetical protein
LPIDRHLTSGNRSLFMIKPAVLQDEEIISYCIVKAAVIGLLNLHTG